MSYGRCENANPECKFYFDKPKLGGNQENGCYSDEDHLFGRGRGMGRLAIRFCELPENKRQICRAEHEEINATYVHLPLPDLDTIKQYMQDRRTGVRNGLQEVYATGDS